MNKEKLISLTKYADDLKNRLSNPVPKKHESHPASYKLFLTRELETVSAKITAAKMDGAAAK